MREGGSVVGCMCTAASARWEGGWYGLFAGDDFLRESPYTGPTGCVHWQLHRTTGWLAQARAYGGLPGTRSFTDPWCVTADDKCWGASLGLGRLRLLGCWLIRSVLVPCSRPLREETGKRW